VPFARLRGKFNKKNYFFEFISLALFFTTNFASPCHSGFVIVIPADINYDNSNNKTSKTFKCKTVCTEKVARNRPLLDFRSFINA
jgi:hypothetical protein